MGIFDYFKPKSVFKPVAVAQSPQYYPQAFSEYIGQKNAITRLEIAISAANKEGRRLGDILLYGYSGTGKTALAQIIAREIRRPIKSIIGGAIETPLDLAQAIATVPDYSIVFIDEIHAMPKKIQELLYTAFDSGELDFTSPGGQVRLTLPPLTLIGATTEIGRLNKPLINRFQNIITLEDYDQEDMQRIISQSIQKLNRQVEIMPHAISAIAKRARFTPRTANNLLANVIDYCLARNKPTCGRSDVLAMAEIMGIYENGITTKDLNLLKVIYEVFGNRPVGLKTLSGACMEDEKTIEQIYEPFLLRKGYIAKTARGRQVTEVGLMLLTRLSNSGKLITNENS